MAYPAGAEVEDSASSRNVAVVVFAEQSDGVVVDVGHEARGGVEVCVVRFIFAAEVSLGIWKGFVPGVVGMYGKG